ncbi:MAG: prolyl oligopeptidase family serine peptidase [Marinoscillum sp.]
MKLLTCLALCSIALIGRAQKAPLLLEMELITDYSGFPIYGRITEEVDGKIVWNKSFGYMDSIEIHHITYLSDGLKVKGLLVKPKEEGTYPCVIYNRGGNRDFGALTIGSAAYLLAPLSNEGYIVIASQYRGNAGGDGQEEFGGKDVNDVTILPAVLQEIDGADTDKIGIYGWSRGGMMTYRALTETDQIKAAAVGGAPSDIFGNIEDRPEMETKVIAELVPNYEQNKEEELNKRSAIKWVDQFPKDVPILMMHGTSDWRVKPEQSLQMALEFEKYRVPYRLIMFEGGDHGLSEHRDEVFDQVVAWFDKYLKNGEALPDMEYHGR